MTRLRALSARHQLLVVALAGAVTVLVLGAGGHRATAQSRTVEHSPALVLVAAQASPQPAGGAAKTSKTNSAPAASARPSTSVPSGKGASGAGASGKGPTGIQVGPTTTTAPTTVAPGGGKVSAPAPPSPGLFDITGHIEAAIDGWFAEVVTDALNPVLTLLGQTLLATPDVTAQGRVGQLWQVSVGMANALLVLFVLAGGAIVMGHETVQTRTALKDVLPRIVFAAIAVNASLSVAGLLISGASALSEALLGQGVGPAQAAVVLSQVVLGSLAGQGTFVVLLGGVVAVLALVLLATYLIRVALVVLLVVAAPLFLVCHALPQTEGLAQLWWRAFAGALAVQVAQSLVLITALQVFLASGGATNLGLASTGGLVDLLVSACLCWVLVKIPSWVSRVVFSGPRRHSSTGRVVRDLVIYKAVRALAAGAGL